jgi:hypothetical protein
MLLLALLAIAVSLIMEIVDCNNINIFARRVSGRASAGLNAKLVVKAR